MKKYQYKINWLYWINIMTLFLIGAGGALYLMYVKSSRVYLPISFLISLVFGIKFDIFKFLSGYNKNTISKKLRILSKSLVLASLILLLFSIKFVIWNSYKITWDWHALIVISAMLTFLGISTCPRPLTSIAAFTILIELGIWTTYVFMFIYPTIGNDTAFHVNSIKYIITTGRFSNQELGKYQYYPALHLIESTFVLIEGIPIRTAHYIWGVTQYIIVFFAPVFVIRTFRNKLFSLNEHSWLFLYAILILFNPYLLQARFWYYISTYLAIFIFIMLVLLWFLEVQLILKYILLVIVYVTITFTHPLVLIYIIIIALTYAILLTLNKMVDRTKMNDFNNVKTLLITLIGIVLPKIFLEEWSIYNTTWFLKRILIIEPWETVTILSKSAPLAYNLLRDFSTICYIIIGGSMIIQLSKKRAKLQIKTEFLLLYGLLILVFPFFLASLFGSVIGARILAMQGLGIALFVSMFLYYFISTRKWKYKIIGVTVLTIMITAGLVSPILGLGRYSLEPRDALEWSEVYPLKFAQTKIGVDNIYGNPRYFRLFLYVPQMTSWQLHHVFSPYHDQDAKYILLRNYDIETGIIIPNFKFGDILVKLELPSCFTYMMKIDKNVIYSTPSTVIFKKS